MVFGKIKRFVEDKRDEREDRQARQQALRIADLEKKRTQVFQKDKLNKKEFQLRKDIATAKNRERRLKDSQFHEMGSEKVIKGISKGFKGARKVLQKKPVKNARGRKGYIKFKNSSINVEPTKKFTVQPISPIDVEEPAEEYVYGVRVR